MYSFNNNILPKIFSNYFLKVNEAHNHNTRFSHNNFTLPLKLSNKGLKTLEYIGAKVWSEIPSAIKNNESLNSFTRHLKDYLLKEINVL